MSFKLLRRVVPLTAIPCLFVLGMALPAAPAAAAAATATAQGTLHFEVVDVQDSMGNSIPMAPPGFSLTLDPPFDNPNADPGNNGSGSVMFSGSAMSSGSGQAAVIDLDSGIECTALPQGSYGGFHDTGNTIQVNNTSGQDIILVFRFDASYALSAAITGPGETAEAEVDINWALPAGTMGSLNACPAGSLSGSTLLLGQDSVSANATSSQPLSSCEIAVTVPDGVLSSGGFAAALTRCSATSPDMVPTLPAAGLATLLALLALAGWRALRRRGIGFEGPASAA